MVTGSNEAVYRATFVHSFLLFVIRITVAANANIIIDTDKIRSVTPSIRICGRDCLKSFKRNGDVRIRRKKITDVKANVRERTSVKVKTTKKGRLRRIGKPVLWLGPPGIV